MKMKGNFLLRGALASLFIGACLGFSQIAAAQQLHIQIVNDSGLPDNEIYIKVPGAKAGESLYPTNLFVDKNNAVNPTNATAIPLSSLTNIPPFHLTSSISGNTDNVYSFQVNYISSGAIYFIYNRPFVFTNGITPSPAPGGGNGGSGYRYDYAELSFLGGIANNDVDLTYVDKFGIPLQLEWFHGTNTAKTNFVDGSYVYDSTKTLASLFASYGFGDAAYSLNTNAGTASGDITPGWVYNGPSSYTNFARIVSPEKANSQGATVYPYPSGTNLLNYAIDHPFVLNGYSVQGGSFTTTNTTTHLVITTNDLYYYLGYQVSAATNVNGGWTFTMAYNSNLLPTNYNLTLMGAVASGSGTTNVSTPLQYTNTIVFSTPVPYTTNIVMGYTNSATNYLATYTNVVTNLCVGAFIYGAPVGTNYTVNGSPVLDTTHPSYNVEAWMIGDVLSSLNFGFVGGIYGSNSDQWYSPKIAWSSYPYGWAQSSSVNNPTNAYYNPYAALMYYEADAYTFAFSERITPDVGMAVGTNDTIRITILPDDRLDSPVPIVQTNLTTDNSITLAWNPVAGASAYQVNLLRPLGTPSVTTSSTNYVFTNLLAGTPCVMSVQAVATNNGNRVITPARPITATTTGTYTTQNGNLLHVSATLTGVADAFSQLKEAYVNGLQLTPQTNGWYNSVGGPVSWEAWQGTNQVPVEVIDQNNNVVFNDWLTFVLSPPVLKNTNFSTTISGLHLYGQLVGTQSTFAGDNGGRNTFRTNDPSMVISLQYVPTEIRKDNPLNVVVTGPSSVTISNVASQRGVGITFDYTVPSNANYVIESSPDLITWQTNYTGIGTGTQLSYTNATANPVQFYRIKL